MRDEIRGLQHQISIQSVENTIGINDIPTWLLISTIVFQIFIIYSAYLGLKNSDVFETLAAKYDKSSFSKVIIALGPVGQAIDRVLTHRAESTESLNNTASDKITAFWSIKSESNIDIVCSEIPDDSKPDFAKPEHRNYLRYAKFADLDSLIYIRYNLAKLAPSSTIRTFTHSEYGDVNTDIKIDVGGPAWNEDAAELQTQLPCHFERNPLGEDDPIVFDLPELEGYKFGPNWSENGDLESDIAIFSKISLEGEKCIFYVAGCLTWGVKGAAKCFLDPEVAHDNLEYVQNKINQADFTLIFEVERYGREISSPRFSEDPPFVLVGYEDSGFEVYTWNIERYRTT